MHPFLRAIRARAGENPRVVAFPETGDPRIQDAVAALHREQCVIPLLVGTPASRREALARIPELEAVAWHDPEEDLDRFAALLVERRGHKGMRMERARSLARDPLMRAALLVGSGEAHGTVGGALHPTGDVLRAAFWGVGTAAGITTVSSSFYMAFSDLLGEGPGVLSYADAAVVPDPDPQQLAEIAVGAARARRRVVGDEPRVAFLSYSTRGSAAGPSVTRAREALERFRELLPEVPADGELQVDAALVPDVAARKAPDSPLAGRANVLVFPDLDAGNIGYKLTQRLAGAAAVGPILQGLRAPCNDLSRGCAVSDVIEVACITGLMAGDRPGETGVSPT